MRRRSLGKEACEQQGPSGGYERGVSCLIHRWGQWPQHCPGRTEGAKFQRHVKEKKPNKAPPRHIHIYLAFDVSKIVRIHSWVTVGYVRTYIHCAAGKLGHRHVCLPPQTYIYIHICAHYTPSGFHCLR